MTVSATSSVKSFAGNGVTVAFAWPYEYRASADLKVVVRNAANASDIKTLNSDYTVSGVSDSHGGYSSATVTMVTAPASGETLVIYRAPSVIQETNVESESSPLYAINNALDLVTYMLQHQANRGVQLPIGVTESFSPTLPDMPDDDGVSYSLGPSPDRLSLGWYAGLDNDAVVSASMIPLMTATTAGTVTAPLYYFCAVTRAAGASGRRCCGVHLDDKRGQLFLRLAWQLYGGNEPSWLERRMAFRFPV